MQVLLQLRYNAMSGLTRLVPAKALFVLLLLIEASGCADSDRVKGSPPNFGHDRSLGGAGPVCGTPTTAVANYSAIDIAQLEQRSLEGRTLSCLEKWLLEQKCTLVLNSHPHPIGLLLRARWEDSEASARLIVAYVCANGRARAAGVRVGDEFAGTNGNEYSGPDLLAQVLRGSTDSIVVRRATERLVLPVGPE